MAADPTASLFEALSRRGHESLLQGTSGTLRFELRQGGRLVYWYVAIDRGDVTVSHSRAEADAVVRTDKTLFDGMATGRVNAMAATLRGVIEAEGDLGLIMSFQRLFPGPPKSVYARKIR
jgi:putative sterol carrier protein